MTDIKNSQNQIIQSPTPSVATPGPVATAAAAQGIGAPSTPLGAASVGATTQQKAMMGTPAQTQNAARVNQQATTPTLDTAERTETAAGATTAQQQAKDKAATLETLGSTKAAVESLIQKQIQQTQTSTPLNPQIAQESLAGITDPTKRQQATDALTAYTQQPTEANLKAVYDVVGHSGLDTGLSQYLDTAANTLSGQAATTAVTVGTLDLSQTGVDQTTLAQTLGVTPEQLNGMTLEELNQKIDATQAQSMQTTQQLQARLSDPALSPQERSQVLAQLKQAGAAGITGVEAHIDSLQGDIESARMVNVAGGDYTVEELLGDEGISSLISGAVNDSSKMAALLRDPKTTSLGQWVQSHKAALAALSTSYDAQSADFVGTQDTLSALGSSLGQGDASRGLVETILGTTLPTSALSGQVAQYQQQLNNSGLYQYLKTDPKLTAELGSDKATLTALVQSGFSSDQIKSAVKLRDELQADPTAMKLLGVDGKIPTTPDQLAALQHATERYEALDPRLVAKAGPHIADDHLTIDDLEHISSSGDPNGVLADLDKWKQVQTNFSNTIKGVDPQLAAKKALFGTTDFTAKDLAYAMQSGSPEAKQTILQLFDANHDGHVADDELVGSAALQKVQQALGIGGTASQIIGQSGQYNGENVQSLLAGLGVDKNSFEKGVSSAISQKLLAQTNAISQSEESETANYQAAVNAAQVAKQAVANAPDTAALQSNTIANLMQYGGMMFGMDQAKAEQLVNAPAAKIQEFMSMYGRDMLGPNITQSLTQLLNVKTANDAIVRADAAATAAKAKLDQVKSSKSKLQNLGYNIGSMNENQLYELGTSMGVI